MGAPKWRDRRCQHGSKPEFRLQLDIATCALPGCTDLALSDMGYRRPEPELIAALKFAEQNCPCGARPESPDTHPHALGCPIGTALAKFSAKARA